MHHSAEVTSEKPPALRMSPPGMSVPPGIPSPPESYTELGLPHSPIAAPYLLRHSSADEEATTHNLSVLGLTYIIKQFHGAWWNGCCFRPKNVKAILRNISLHLQSQEITAILGNSGSGKTSLLDVIACRSTGQVVGGIYLDGKLMTEEMFRARAGYVIQSDHFLPNLTVRETLTYVARLKFAMADKKAIAERVDEVLVDMGIQYIAESRMGGLITRGISGGERRRVSIAAQLLQDPKLLLLDEPTTGLDSFTAYYLIKTISDLAKKRNKIVLMSIHQPRSDIYNLFDNVGILTKGEMVYMGPAKQLVPHFVNLGYPCPTYANPCDHYLDLASLDYRSARKEQESMLRVESLKNGYFHSQMFRNTLSDIHGCCHFLDRVETFGVNPLGVPAPPGYMMTLGTLTGRMVINVFRDKINFIARFSQLSCFCIFLFLFLFRLKYNTGSIQDRVGLLYQSGQTPAYVGMLSAVTLFPPLRNQLYRESRDGLYGPLVFLNAYFVFALPFALGASVIFSTFNYWALNMYPDTTRYGVYLAVVFMMHYGGELLGVLFLGLFDNVSVAASATSLILALTGLLSSGFLRSIQSMPKAIQILSYGTVFKYSSEIFVANEFHDLQFDCQSLNNTECVIPDGDVFLDVLYPGALDNFNRNFGITAAFTFRYAVFGIITYRVLGLRQLH